MKNRIHGQRHQPRFRSVLFVIVAMAIGLAGCFDDDDPIVRPDDTMTINPPGGSDGASISLTHACGDRQPIAIRVFQFSRISSDVVDATSYTNRAWPGGGNVWVLQHGETLSQQLRCDNPAYWACYGGERHNSADRRFWGTGLDHSNDCERCCASCSGGSLRYRLTC